MITVTTYKWVPPLARGLVRDLRVRWALNEAGLDYQTRLIAVDEAKQADHRACQPFGQVPTYEEDGLVLFESGAIVLHIGARSEALLPADPNARARAVTWVLAALNTVELVVDALAEVDLFYPDAEWAAARRPLVVADVHRRLTELAAWLGDREHLEGRFTAGDLMMTTVLRALRHTDLLDAYPTLAAYKQRCEARPAFQAALAAHMAVFAGASD